MQYTIPDYYDDFSCIGGACPDTCCAGWQIVIDENSLEQYKSVEGPFGNRLKNEIDWKEKVFRQYQGDCCFLNEDKLCDIYAEIGKDKLCKTCRVYPRHIEEYEGLREVSLSISCPIVADLILGRQEKVTILEKEDEIEEKEEYEDFDWFFFTKLQDTMEYLLKILQNREMDIFVRFGIATAFGHDMQRRVRTNEIFSIDNLLDKYENTDVLSFFVRKKDSYSMNGKERYLFMKEIFALLSKLEIRTEQWHKQLKYCTKQLKHMNWEEYCKKLRVFRKKQWNSPKRQKERALYLEQMAVYFLLTYYCGAVYDDKLYHKVKMSIVSSLVVEDILFLNWLSKPKEIQKKDWVKIVYQYSRELEHSDINLKRMENGLGKRKEYGLLQMLSSFFWM